jgi:trans-2,3-dihydro-3-hydroxyanthranilate isomerase
MDRNYRFRIVNVFAESTFGGNPLCVFEDATGLSDGEMQALARQFNLSETTFILPCSAATATAAVRIFTPGHELPFAGHPALGSAHVIRDLSGAGDELTMQFKAGIVPVSARGNEWSFTAPVAGRPKPRPASEPAALIARLIGLPTADLEGDPVWVNTGAEQLLIPLRSPDAVRRASPDTALLDQWPANSLGRKTGYVFAFEVETQAAVLARYFTVLPSGGVGEDPGTGSACANLGGWLLHHAHPTPSRMLVSQGEAVSRACRLVLELTAGGEIRVGGTVRALAAGTVKLPGPPLS